MMICIGDSEFEPVVGSSAISPILKIRSNVLKSTFSLKIEKNSENPSPNKKIYFQQFSRKPNKIYINWEAVMIF